MCSASTRRPHRHSRHARQELRPHDRISLSLSFEIDIAVTRGRNCDRAPHRRRFAPRPLRQAAGRRHAACSDARHARHPVPREAPQGTQAASLPAGTRARGAAHAGRSRVFGKPGLAMDATRKVRWRAGRTGARCRTAARRLRAPLPNAVRGASTPAPRRGRAGSPPRPHEKYARHARAGCFPTGSSGCTACPLGPSCTSRPRTGSRQESPPRARPDARTP